MPKTGGRRTSSTGDGLRDAAAVLGVRIGIWRAIVKAMRKTAFVYLHGRAPDGESRRACGRFTLPRATQAANQSSSVI